MQCRIQDGSVFNISFWGSHITWSKVCQNGNKCNSLYFGGKQSSDHDKEINTVNETPVCLAKQKNASSRRHERINTRFDGKKKKTQITFCEFCRGFPNRKKRNFTPWGYEWKNIKMIRVISSFADGPVNFNPTGPAKTRPNS